jgi:hypothetical protein
VKIGVAASVVSAFVCLASAFNPVGQARAMELDAQKPASCRNLAAEMTWDTVGAKGFTASIKTSCTFDAKTLTVSCTSNYRDNQGTLSSSTSLTKYTAIADIIDETAVIPPLDYSVSTTTTQTDAKGKTTNSTATSFDSRRRITKTVSRSASGDASITYEAWDPAGRPVLATDVAGSRKNTLTILYDGPRRTRTTVVNEGPLRTVETFDADGNQITTLTTTGDAATATATTIKITARQRVCR